MKYTKSAFTLLFTLLFILSCLRTLSSMNAPAAAQLSPPNATLRFVLGDSHAAIANQALWLSCYRDTTALQLLSQQWVLTDGEGRVESLKTSDCPLVAALLPLHEQPSGKANHGPAYWVFAASWPTGSGVPTFANPCRDPLCETTQDVVLQTEWPLVLFNVVVSLEWEPAAGDMYVAELYEGLQSASGYLADLTDGYMAFGPVTIHTAGRNWEGADMRFQAANDRRPAAFVGGIVPQTIIYTPTAISTTTLPTITLRPAASFFGRYWQRTADASAGAWNQPDGFRTLVHEWAHYALFLYDEYQGEQGKIISCVPLDLRSTLPTEIEEWTASAMSWQYQSSELWHPSHIADPFFPHSCYDTDQYRSHGESDWTTLTKWFAIQQLSHKAGLPVLRLAETPEPNLFAPEQAIVANFFGRSLVERARLYLPWVSRAGIATPAPTTKTMAVYTNDSPTEPPTQFTQVYLLEAGAAASTRLLYQGTPLGGSGQLGYLGNLSLLGVDAQADARILVDRYTYTNTSGSIMTGGRFLYPAPGEQADLTAAKVVALSDSNDLSLDLVYGMSRDDNGEPARLTRITVVVDDPGKASVIKPYAQLCTPDAEIGCPLAWGQVMTPTKDGSWYADFAPLTQTAEFPLYGLVRVSDAVTQQDSLLRWFRDVGGISPSPGHKTGAPTIDGADESVALRKLDGEELDGECNRVLIMPSARYALLFAKSSPGFRLVGPPMDVDILLGNTSVERGLPICTHSQSEIRVRLAMAYPQSEIERLGIDETYLQIFRYDAQLGWRPVVSQTMQTPPTPTPTPPGHKASAATAIATQDWEQRTHSAAINKPDEDLNWVTAVITATSGIYAIGWLP